MCLFLEAHLPICSFLHGFTVHYFVHHLVVRLIIVASEFLLGNHPIAIYFCILVSIPFSVKFTLHHGTWVINSHYSKGDFIFQCFLQMCQVASTVLTFRLVNSSIQLSPSPSLIVVFADHIFRQLCPSIVH